MSSLIVTQKSGAGGGAATGGVNGSVFITDVDPQSPSDNISNKVFSSDGVVLDSFTTSTNLVRVYVLALPGDTNYKPVVTVNGNTVTNMTAEADKPEFTGFIDIDLTAATDITAVHEDGAQHSSNFTFAAAPTVTAAIFAGAYPGSQTELKEDDTFSLQVTADANIKEIELDDFGASKPEVFPFGTTSTTETAVIDIADRGTTVQSLGARVRVKDTNDTWSAWFLTTSAGSTDGVHTLQLNNLFPSIVIGSITYPATQGAIKDSESATVVNTVTDFDTISYTSPGAELSITNTTTYETPKSVSRIGGTYNVTVDNFQISANRAANDATTVDATVVFIAHVAASVSVTEPATRLVSSASGTDHEISIVSDQILNSAPSLTEAEGTFQGSWVSGDNITWTRDLRVLDTDARGIHNWTALSATNLAGIVTSTITGNDTYEIGGFESRDIYFSPFANEAALGVSVADASKLVAVDKDLIAMTYVGNDFSDVTRTFTITQPTGVFNATGNILHWNDVTEVNNNTTGLSFIRIREDA